MQHLSNCLKDSFHIVISGALPVLLSSFTATVNNDKVFLDWTTQTETNNKYFTIERSADGVNFNLSGKVNGAGNSANTNTYRLIDYAPLPGINYYRLSQTGNDGTYCLSWYKKS